MTVVPMPARGQWYADARGSDDDRCLRASWHPEQGCVVLSTWKDGTCTGTARLTPDDAARLVSLLTSGLADLAAGRAAAVPVAEAGATGG